MTKPNRIWGMAVSAALLLAFPIYIHFGSGRGGWTVLGFEALGVFLVLLLT